MSHLIGLDAGTTGVTAILYTHDLKQVRRAYTEFAQHFPTPGRVEHEAQDIRAAIASTLAELLQGWSDPISALGITNQRETVFALDRKTGRALGRGIVWQDRRTRDRCEELDQQGMEALVHARTGLRLDPYFSASKMEWLKRNVDGVAQGVRDGQVVFATVDALVCQALCGGETWRTDPTNACRTMLFDIEKRCWDEELCALFGVPLSALPEVLPSTGAFGVTSLPNGQSVPVCGVAGDQQAALFGQGCWGAGDFKTTYGTGCFLVLNTGAERKDSTGGLLTTLALDASGKPCFAIEGSVFTGGAVIQWLRDGLGLIASAGESQALAEQVPDSGGVVLVPAFAGLGAPHWDPDARAALLGMTRGTNKSHVARAALESIALQCTDIVELLRKETGLPLDVLRVDGGAVQNDLLMQIQADLAGAIVLRPNDVDSTARGVAALAGVGVGLWSTPAGAAAFTEAPERFVPSMPASQRESIQAAWQAGLARIRS